MGAWETDQRRSGPGLNSHRRLNQGNYIGFHENRGALANPGELFNRNILTAGIKNPLFGIAGLDDESIPRRFPKCRQDEVSCAVVKSNSQAHVFLYNTSPLADLDGSEAFL
jgi:hypothetical protein